MVKKLLTNKFNQEMEKKFYEMPEMKVVDLEGEVLLLDGSKDPDDLVDGPTIGGPGEGGGLSKGAADDWED